LRREFHRCLCRWRQGRRFFESIDKIADDTLLKIREDLGECTRCKLHGTRHTIVFGTETRKAELVFVGEGPGADEDAQGLPFVGRAGKLLTQMIEAMGLQRKDVYICNVVKCRPPENRQPEEDEVSTCSPFLLRQIDAIAPKVIVCLGAVAAKTLLQTNRGFHNFAESGWNFRGRKLLATYHPAYLLRNPPAKSEVWKRSPKSDGRPRPRSQKRQACRGRQVRVIHHGILLGLLTALTWGGADFLARFATRRIGTLRAMFYMQGIGFVLLTIFLPWLGGWGHLTDGSGWRPWAWACSRRHQRVFDAGALSGV